MSTESGAAPLTAVAGDPFPGLPGAVVGATGTPAHYGQPAAEQRALAGGRAIVDLADRSVISIAGEGRLAWLDSFVTQTLTGMQPGDSAEALLLDPTGRIEHAMGVIDDGTTTRLLVERAQLASLAKFLVSMRFRTPLRLLDESDDYATVGALGPDTAQAVAFLREHAAAPDGVPLVWRDPWNTPSPFGWQYAAALSPYGLPHPSAGWQGVEALVPRAALADLLTAAATSGIAIAGADALEALRIEAWRPRWATEVDGRAIPHEADWLRTAVHLDKGCYRGQETVAKVHNLGHPPRRLVLLQLDGSEGDLPARGAGVFLLVDGPEGRKQVGVVTTSARHHEQGGIALALVRRTTPEDAVLVVDASGTDVAAAQEIIVPASAGATIEVARPPRLGQR
jgi:tRNA-modifying protein YgfZ